MKHDKQKSHGIHYTPPELAGFLAKVTFGHIRKERGSIDVLDPACGGGSLLYAMCQAVSARVRKRLVLFGFEREGEEILKRGVSPFGNNIPPSLLPCQGQGVGGTGYQITSP